MSADNRLVQNGVTVGLSGNDTIDIFAPGTTEVVLDANDLIF